MVSERTKQVLSALLYGVTSIAIMTTNKAVLTTFQYVQVSLTQSLTLHTRPPLILTS